MFRMLETASIKKTYGHNVKELLPFPSTTILVRNVLFENFMFFLVKKILSSQSKLFLKHLLNFEI